MPLDRLPYDVLFNTASYLDLRDVVHLSLLSRQLRLILGENTLCRRIVETRIAGTPEAQCAESGRLSYRDAILRVYNRREAFAAASPTSACVVGYGTSFLYRQGVLCYVAGECVRIKDIHTSSAAGTVVNVCAVVREALPQVGSLGSVSLLHYSDQILALHCGNNGSGGSWLIALDTGVHKHDDDRVILKHWLEDNNRLFVRHTATCLYYGTHTSVGAHGHNEWKLEAFSLPQPCDPQSKSRSKRLGSVHLDNFVGYEIGSTVAFEIHNGYFYALSNQTSFEVVEIDWTSFYKCVRIPLSKPRKEDVEINDRIYRRQHREGPINDSWTDLSMQVDQCTGALMIVEARKENLMNASSQQRTFYMEPLVFPEPGGSDFDDSTTPLSGSAPSSSPGGVGTSASSNAYALPCNDPLASAMTSSDNPNFAKAKIRLPKHTHSEHSHPGDAARSYMLSRTLFRGYNLSCAAFLDLVRDEAHGSPSLRMGSRRRAPALDETGMVKVPLVDPETRDRTEASEDEFVYAPIRHVPVAAGVLTDHEDPRPSLAPPRSCAVASAAMDDRSLLYSIADPRRPHADRAIVLVSFDPAIKAAHVAVRAGDATACSVSCSGSGGSEDRARTERDDEARQAAAMRGGVHDGLAASLRDDACRRSLELGLGLGLGFR
ncbi:F-box domain-containing protein [Cryomyces antarcticus]